MSGKAGYSLGEKIAKMLEYKFSSKPAKVIAKFGEILGLILMCGGFIVTIMDHYLGTFYGEFRLPALLIAVAGLALLIALHWIAMRIDRKYISKS